MTDKLGIAHPDAAVHDEAKAQLRDDLAALSSRPDNGDDRDIFALALEDKLASDQHEEYVKENN